MLSTKQICCFCELICNKLSKYFVLRLWMVTERGPCGFVCLSWAHPLPWVFWQPRLGLSPAWVQPVFLNERGGEGRVWEILCTRVHMVACSHYLFNTGPLFVCVSNISNWGIHINSWSGVCNIFNCKNGWKLLGKPVWIPLFSIIEITKYLFIHN